MSESVLCSLFGTIAQLLGTVLSIIAGIIVVSMQRGQYAIDQHKENFRKVPRLLPVEHTHWMFKCMGGRANEWHEWFLGHIRQGELSTIEIQQIQLAGFALAEAGNKHNRTVKLFKITMGIGIPTVILALVALCFTSQMVGTGWWAALIVAVLMVATAVSLSVAGWMMVVATIGGHTLPDPGKAEEKAKQTAAKSRPAEVC